MAESIPLGGTDPGADYSGAATLASVRLSKVTIGGYDPGEVEALRKRALNTIAYLEAQVEALQVQLQSMRSLLDASGPEALAKGLVLLAKALRARFDDQEVATIITAPAAVSEQHAQVFPTRLAEFALGTAPAGIGTGDASTW